jgi:hypothetical protein
MTAGLAQRKVFVTHIQAADHLERMGFTFVGAPNRWQRTRHARTVTARIIASNRLFYIRTSQARSL